jgi:Pilus assembly protein, PilO
MMKRTLTRRSLAGLAAAVVVAAAAGWFLLVAPKNSEAESVAQEISATELSIAAKRRANVEALRLRREAARLEKLLSALPNESEMPRIILELDRLATTSGLTFSSIAPQAPVAGAGVQIVPLQVTLQGRFAKLTSFFAKVRKMVAQHEDELLLKGRLYTVDQFQLAEGDAKYPHLRATMTLNAFVYSPVVAGATPAPATDGEATAAPATP